MKRYESTLFSHDLERKIFTAEAAELAGCGEVLFEAPAKNHPAVGLTIVSSKTGVAADFLVQHVERNVDRDIDFWRLTPTLATVAAHPELNNYVVEIFND